MVKKKTIKDYQRELRKAKRDHKKEIAKLKEFNEALGLQKKVDDLQKRWADQEETIGLLDLQLMNERDIITNLKIALNKSLNLAATTITILKKKNTFLEGELHDVTLQIIKDSKSSSTDYFLKSLDWINFAGDQAEFEKFLKRMN